MTLMPKSDQRLKTSAHGASFVGGIFLVLTLCLSTSAAADEEHEFAGHKKCKKCHEKDDIGNQYDTWLNSKHATTYETLASEKAKEWGAEAGVENPQTDEKCIQCHTTAHGVPGEMVSRKFDRTAGVQCEACHGAGKDFRKKKIMIDRDQAIAKGLVPQDEKVCIRCHNDKSPAWDPKRFTLEDGSQSGFDYQQALKKIAHPVPEGYDPLAGGEAD